MRRLEVRRLGHVAYDDGLKMQAALVEERKSGVIPDTLLLLEHPHVLTLGVRGGGRRHIVAPDNRLDALGVSVFETGRGGDVTYHGPGQIVGYPILDLRPDRQDVHRYVRDLEEVLIRTCTDFGVAAGRLPGLTGTWVTGVTASIPPVANDPYVARDFSPANPANPPTPAKIAAIGVRIARWITSHGFAFNVNVQLSYFDLIVPCGISDKRVTSLQQILGHPVELVAVEDRLVTRFAEVFDRTVSESE